MIVDTYELSSGLHVIVHEYQCTSCDATDKYKLFSDEAVPSVIACLACKAGINLRASEMLATGTGMLPTPEPKEAA